REIMRTLITASATVLVLAGCSSAEQTSASRGSGADNRAETTSTATSTYWTKEEAGKKYLAMVQPSNAALAELKSANTAGNLKGIQAACVKIADLDGKLVQDLDTGEWDPTLRPQVDDVMASVTSQRKFFVTCSKVSSLKEWSALTVPEDPKPGSASALRTQLGLGVADK
ncbi:MAG: hypothetical protein ACK5MP_00240, partial [Nostocoides sp.]